MSDTRLFHGFLADVSAYAAAEGSWHAILSAPGWRQGWLNTSFANGTPMRDGNPIASAIHVGKGRGVRVVQECDEQVAVSGWVAHVEGLQGPIEELVVHIVATDGTMKKARACIEHWMNGGVAGDALDLLD